MKKIKTFIIIAASGLMLAGCGSSTANSPLSTIFGGAAAGAAAQQQGAETSGTANQGILGGLLGGLLGNITPVDAARLKGDWTYASPECRFESENLLTKAGGMVAANQLKNKLSSYLAKVGIQEGSTTFQFDGDKDCVIYTGNNPVFSGTYTVNPETHAIVINGPTGLVNLTGTAYLSGNTLTLLFDSNKLLTFIKGASTMLGKNAGSVSSLFNYDGMQLGVNLSK